MDRNLSQIVEKSLEMTGRCLDSPMKLQRLRRPDSTKKRDCRQDKRLPKLLGCIAIGIFPWDAETPITSVRDVGNL